MQLRDYQQRAVDAAVSWIKKTIDPAVLELATGAGKSYIVAAIAQWVRNKSGKKVLVLAPSKELVEQDYAKYLLTGEPASIWCASIEKSLKHDVVFGTPQSVNNAIDRFGSFACVIIDEGDGITNTVKNIVNKLKERNRNLRVLGLTGTPYRLGTGYIYEYDENGKAVPELQTRNPYYHSLLCKITANELIERGFLTPPHADDEHIDGYDAAKLELNNRGQFDAKQVEEVFEGKGRLTSMIVADIVQKSQNRHGVLLFAATVQHAYEVLESLPQHNSAIIHGGTPKPERESIIERFKRKRIKYLVNVAVLTTGFDAPHVDVVAILRATESVRLLQQIIGRGLRLVRPELAGDLHAIANSEKPDCLVLDYAQNIQRHCPDGDLFSPNVTASMVGTSGEPVLAKCEHCGYQNEFTARPNKDEFGIDENGYFLDLEGLRVVTDKGQEMPAHFGRRCRGQTIIKGIHEQCEYRWSVKECHECDHENDIAARYCEACRAEIVDPNEKLAIEHAKIKKDPYTATSDRVLNWKYQEWISQRGNETLRLDFTTEYRTFTVWLMQYKDVKDERRKRVWIELCKACGLLEKAPKTAAAFVALNPKMPETVTAVKNRKSGFYDVVGFNYKEDVLDENT